MERVKENLQSVSYLSSIAVIIAQRVATRETKNLIVHMYYADKTLVNSKLILIRL